jgi:glycosyltransferase involved in cell wall biosynthesis
MLTAGPMAALERHVIRKASVGLFHGRETFDTYAPYARRAELVHDIHIAAADHLAPTDRNAKIATAAEGPLRVIYVGRADPMKGGLDWVEALIRLRSGGADVTATWIGDGSDLPEMRARIASAGLEDRVSFPGFASDRADVLQALRAAHLMMFCHKTPESPRNLIEALISATPIVGYAGAYAKDLIAVNQGGVLVPMNDVAALVKAVANLAEDRGRLADLIGRAAKDGAPYNDVEVFHHRSAMIRKHMARRGTLTA